jgi:DeoR family transcriptional regulator of aga operon
MVESAAKTVFLADHDKIGKVASAFVSDISGADILITDDAADPATLKELKAAGLAIDMVRPKVE